MSDFKLLGTEMTMKANGNVGPFIIKVGKIWKIVVKWQVINCSAILWQKQPTFQWNDDDVFFELDQQTWTFILLAHWNNSLSELALNLEYMSEHRLLFQWASSESGIYVWAQTIVSVS
jgi:hypothetical protein